MHWFPHTHKKLTTFYHNLISGFYCSLYPLAISAFLLYFTFLNVTFQGRRTESSFCSKSDFKVRFPSSFPHLSWVMLFILPASNYPEVQKELINGDVCIPVWLQLSLGIVKFLYWILIYLESFFNKAGEKWIKTQRWSSSFLLGCRAGNKMQKTKKTK